MNRARLVAAALAAGLFAAQSAMAAPPVPPMMPLELTEPVDADCMKTLNDTAQQARKTNNTYLAVLKGMKENPYAGGAASICSSALARADQYFKKNLTATALCTSSSDYTDGQVRQLYKNSTITCRSETATVVKRLSPDEQAATLSQLRQQGVNLN